MTLVNGDILKVTWECAFPDGELSQNVYRLRLTTLGFLTDVAVLSHIETWLETVYTTLVSEVKSGMVIQPCTVDLEEWDTDKWVISRNIGYVTPTVAFGETGELLPKQCSAFAQFKTDRPKSSGRKFLAGFTEPDTTFGYLSSTALSALADYAAAVLLGIPVDLDTYFTSGIVRQAANEFLPFLLAIVTDTMFTQRRRVRGVGV